MASLAFKALKSSERAVAIVMMSSGTILSVALRTFSINKAFFITAALTFASVSSLLSF